MDSKPAPITWVLSWRILPVVAAIGGAWASGAFQSEDWLSQVAAVMGLIIGGWAPFWRAITASDWATPLVLWQNWSHETQLPLWPYLQPDTPGAKLHRVLGQARAWWQQVGRDTLAQPLGMALRAIVVSLLIGLALTRTALLLSLIFIAWTEIAALWHGGRGDLGSFWKAGAQVGLPWLLGASLVEDSLIFPSLTAIMLTLLAAGFAHPTVLAISGPILMAVFLIWQGHSLAAGGILLLAIPGLMLIPHHLQRRIYRQAVGPWLLAMVLLVTLVI